MARRKGKPAAKTDAKRIVNRKAKHDYHIEETVVCGIVLRGSEVKSIRAGNVSLAEGYARVEPATGELWLYNVDIALYSHAAPDRQHDPKAKRKLLAHRSEINRLMGRTTAKGATLIPLSLFFNERGIAKLELAVATGRAKADKREAIKRKDDRRDMRRAISKRM